MISTNAGLTSMMATTAETGGTKFPPGGVNPGVIAAAVIVPLAVIAVIAGALVFYWYRKKYPMRGALGKVALGRDASKYQNPMYMTPKEGRNHTLIRNTGNVHGQENLAFDDESQLSGTKAEEPVNKPSLTKPSDALESSEDLSDSRGSITLKKDHPSAEKQQPHVEVEKEMLKQEEKSYKTVTATTKPADIEAGAPVSEVKERDVPRSARSLKRAANNLGVTGMQTSELAKGGIIKPQHSLEALESSEDLSDTIGSITLKKDHPSAEKQQPHVEVVKEMLKQEEKSSNTVTATTKPADIEAGAPVSEVKETDVPRSARSLKRASDHLGVTFMQMPEGAKSGIIKPQHSLERLKSFSRDYSIDDIESILSEDEAKEKPGPGTARNGNLDSDRRNDGQSSQAEPPTSNYIRVQQSPKSAKPALTRQQATDIGDGEKSKTREAVQNSDSTKTSIVDISRDFAVKDKKSANMTSTPAPEQGTGGKKDTAPLSKASQSVSTNKGKPKGSSTGGSVNAQSKSKANSSLDGYDDKLNPFGSD